MSLSGGDVILELTAPSPIQVSVSLESTAIVADPAAVVDAMFDLGDDGSPEIVAGAVQQGANLLRVLGPVPTRLRARIGFTSPATGILSVTLGVTVRPAGAMQVQSWFRDCTLRPQAFVAEPTFSDDLQLQSAPRPGELHVAVFGFGLQPVTVGASGWLPCVLMPRVDAHVFLGIGTSVGSVSIPPAVRPLVFYTQAVAIDLVGGAVYTTDGWLVGAR